MIYAKMRYYLHGEAENKLLAEGSLLSHYICDVSISHSGAPLAAVESREEANGSCSAAAAVCDATHCPCVMPDLRLLQSLPCQALLKITKI